MVHAGNDRVVEDGEALANRQRGVVKKGVEVGIAAESEASHAGMSAVEYEERAIWKPSDTGHHTLRWLARESLHC